MTYYYYLAQVMKAKSIRACAQAALDSCCDPDIAPPDSNDIYEFAKERLTSLLSDEFIRLQKGGK